MAVYIFLYCSGFCLPDVIFLVCYIKRLNKGISCLNSACLEREPNFDALCWGFFLRSAKELLAGSIRKSELSLNVKICDCFILLILLHA